jgi:hypothetical protein
MEAVLRIVSLLPASSLECLAPLADRTQVEALRHGHRRPICSLEEIDRTRSTPIEVV